MTSMGKRVTSVGKETACANSKFIKKHTATIHCANSLSLLQRKISNALFFHAYNELLIKQEHHISLKVLCGIIEYSGHNYGAIKDAMRKLVSTILEWNIVDNGTGEEDWSATTVLSSVRIHRDICTYSYSPRIKQLMYHPSTYGKINMSVQCRFRSSYGLALYENCIRYLGMPNTKWFSLEIFRKLMGVPENEYLIFRDFKRRVIDKSVEEVNAYSGITVVPEFERVGRAVTRIKFNLIESRKIKPHVEADTQNISSAKEDVLLEQLIQTFGISPSRAEALLSQYERDYLEQKILLVTNSKSFRDGKISNIGAYLISAITENYPLPVTSYDSISKNNAIQEKLNEEIKRDAQKQEDMRKKYDKFVSNRFFALLNALEESLRNSLLGKWLEEVKESPLIMRLYHKDGLEHPAVYETFRQYLIANRPDIYLENCSFSDFSEMMKYE